VRDAGQDPRLALEPRVGDVDRVGVEDLDRDRPLQDRLLAAEHHAHAAAADLFLQLDAVDRRQAPFGRDSGSLGDVVAAALRVGQGVGHERDFLMNSRICCTGGRSARFWPT
jgi:hypothetical protein